MLVTTTIGITPDTMSRCVQYGINRSKVCREALEKEIKKIEEAGEQSAKTAPAASPNGEAL